MRVLTEPRNAVTRQFERFLQLDKVESIFTDGAIEAAAEQALGAEDRRPRTALDHRGVAARRHARIPHCPDVRKCIITEEVIRDGRAPLLLTKAHLEQGLSETNYEGLLEQGA